MELITTSYGGPATAALVAAVVGGKGGDPLAPVTVVVPHNYAGVSARRSLGRSVVTGNAPGVAAVSFLTPYRLAELLGGSFLAAQQRRPVSTAVLAATVRGVLADEPGLFVEVREHPGTERALVAAHRELSELSEAGLKRLERQGPRAGDVVRIHRQVQNKLGPDWYVETDLADAARRAVEATPEVLDRFGPLVWHLPQALTPSMGQLAKTIGAQVPCTVIAGVTGVRTADEAVVTTLNRLGFEPDDLAARPPPLPVASHTIEVISGSDADEEVRVVVRGVINATRRGIPLDAMAVLHAGREPYGRLLHEQLAAAGIAVNGTTPRRLAESVVGRTLTALLDLPEREFRRTDVMALLASSPVRWRGNLAPTSAWERASRAAAVVRGTDQWAERLGAYSAETRVRAAEFRDAEDRDWLSDRLESDAKRAESLADFVAQLAKDLSAAETESSWRRRSRWASRLIEKYLSKPDDSWPPIEREAADNVQAALDRLAGLDAVEASPSATVFRRTLLHELDASLGRVGRLGSGVLVASPADAVGVDFEQVFLVGLAEGSFPARVRDDSLLPDRERAAAGGDLPRRADRPHDEHRQLLAVLAAADSATITWPRGDLRRNAERMPSRWLVDIVKQAGVEVSGPGLVGAEADWIRDISSHVGGLLASPFPPSDHEFGLRSLLDNDRAGHPAREHPILLVRPSLSRGLELVGARRSNDLTRFDGFIGPQPSLDPTSEALVLSATRLETWVQCPMKYFMQYVLKVQPIEEADELFEISVLDRGSLIHAVLEDFIGEVIGRPKSDQPEPQQSWTGSDHQRIVSIAETHMLALEEKGLVGRDVYWRPTRRAIVGELSAFLANDNDYRREMGARVNAAELGFGLSNSSEPALEWELADGRILRFRGSADRVDTLPNGGIAVLDYKTGSSAKYKGVSTEHPDVEGSILQLPIYAMAARAALNWPDAPVYTAYWFASTKQKFQRIGYDLTDKVIDRFNEVFAAAANGIASGAFVAHPDEPSSFVLFIPCPYCDPDGLGTRHRWIEWERKRHAPEVGPYLSLVEPGTGSEPQAKL